MPRSVGWYVPLATKKKSHTATHSNTMAALLALAPAAPAAPAQMPAMCRQLENTKWVAAYLVLLAEPNLDSIEAATHGDWLFRLERKPGGRIHAVTLYSNMLMIDHEYLDGPTDVTEETLEQVRAFRRARRGSLGEDDI
jgi:hypothetical protein